VHARHGRAFAPLLQYVGRGLLEDNSTWRAISVWVNYRYLGYVDENGSQRGAVTSINITPFTPQKVQLLRAEPGWSYNFVYQV
jgi:hypothetical protein